MSFSSQKFSLLKNFFISYFFLAILFENFLLTFSLFSVWNYYLEIGLPVSLILSFPFQYYCSCLGLFVLLRFLRTFS